MMIKNYNFLIVSFSFFIKPMFLAKEPDVFIQRTVNEGITILSKNIKR